MPFRAQHKSEMILVIIIMPIHMVFTEVKPPKWLINGRRCQLLPYKAAGLLELMIQSHLRNLTLPLSFLQQPEKINKA